jgi:hypothetical protein
MNAIQDEPTVRVASHRHVVGRLGLPIEQPEHWPFASTGTKLQCLPAF